MFHDMPNATQQDFIQRFNSGPGRVPSDATWGLDMFMDKAAEMQTVNLTLIREMPEEERQAYCLCTTEEQQAESEGAKHNAPMHNLMIRDLKKSVDAHDHPGVYGTMQPTWKDAGCELLQNVTNVRLAEYFIGTSTLIPMPQDYLPGDGIKWSVNVMEHRASKRHQGGHAFQVLLAESLYHTSVHS